MGLNGSIIFFFIEVPYLFNQLILRFSFSVLNIINNVIMDNFKYSVLCIILFWGRQYS